MKPRLDVLEWLATHGVLRPLDAELGHCLRELDGDADSPLGLLAAVTSLAVSQGHSCLPLAHLAEVLHEAAAGLTALPPLPGADALRDALRDSPWAAEAQPDATLPLLYDAEDRVWLGRYFHYERQVADALRTRLALPVDAPDVQALREALQPFFTLDAEHPDAQAVAALTGLVSPWTVITGGPGTGKTTTVLWLLAAWIGLRLQAGQDKPKILLAAPTGKAAARLSESLRQRVADLPVSDTVRAAIPQTASTLHRLLGTRRGSSRFVHHAGHPLDADLVVVDEVSMVDLPLMAKLLDALPPHARLVLLGDRDQLASVEAGNVLAAICAAAGEGAVSAPRADLIRHVTGWAWPQAESVPALADTVVALDTSHRVREGSGLGPLAAHIRAGAVQAVVQGLAEQAFAGVDLDTGVSTRPAAALLERHLHTFAVLADMRDPQQALALAARSRILTALREGPAGSRTINAAFEHALRQRAGVDAEAAHYPGQLLLITSNDYGNGLFNGDMGIVLTDGQGVLRAWFAADDGALRKLPLSVLPDHAPGFAMTIHKSQGSEFDEVSIVLPASDARVLGRELLYTAITRARSRVHLLATETVLAATIARSTRRHSGLADRLG